MRGVTGVDISGGMLAEARARVASMGAAAEAAFDLVEADATATGLPAGSYDTVVDTFSLCTFDKVCARARASAGLGSACAGACAC